MCLVSFMSVAHKGGGDNRKSSSDEVAIYETVDKGTNKLSSKEVGRGIPRSHPHPAAARINLSYTIKRLKWCGWYWGDITSDQAKGILRNTQNGSFILRDSTDACHLFSLSLKANNIVISVRVAFSRGLFKLDSWNQDDSPSFPSVVDLIDHYLEDSSRMFYVELPKVGEFPVCLKHPIWKEVPMLQHLCRTKIVRHCRTSERLKLLPLPIHLIRYVDVLGSSVNGSNTVFDNDGGSVEDGISLEGDDDHPDS